MKSLSLSLFLLGFTLLAYKPLPPGAGAAVKPNVLFIIDDSGSMGYSCRGANDLNNTSRTSKMCQTKRALKLLFEDDSITQNIRYGLTEFPRHSCGSKKMLLVPVRNRDDMDIYKNDGSTKLHKTFIKDEMLKIPTNNCTPLGKVAYLTRRYFQGHASSDGSIINNFDTAIAESPIIDKCQKNYIVLFTDGGEYCNKCNNSDPWKGIITESTKMQQKPLQGFVTKNGDTMASGNENIDLYAVGLGNGISTSTMNTIASNGGTQHGYFANNDPSKILEIFQQIIADIGAKNITSTTPTLIPGFAGPENDVVYLTNFQPREHKQWSGHLFKYKLSATGNNVLAGAPKWDLAQKLTANLDSRNVYTVCKDMSGHTIKDVPGTNLANFSLNNAKDIAFCMLQGANNGAGNPMIAGIRQTFPWGNEVTGCSGTGWEDHYDPNTGNVDGCMPTREWIDPVCKGSENIVDMINDQFENYRSYCGAGDFEDYALGFPLPPVGDPNSILEYDASGSKRCKSGTQTITLPDGSTRTLTQREKARIIQRYLCQGASHAFCGCFEPWEGSPAPDVNRAKMCINGVGEEDNTLCGGTNATPRDPSKPSCYAGYCVGKPAQYDKNAVWEKQDMANYKNGIKSELEIGSDGTGSIKLKLRNLKFNSQNNSNVGSNGAISDYLVIQEIRDGGGNISHIITTRKENGTDKTLIYNCFSTPSIPNLGNNIHIPDTCIEHTISGGELVFPILTNSQQNDDTDYNTKKLRLTFRSNMHHNDLAFILESYSLKPKDVVNYRWAFSGDENEKEGDRDAFDVDDIKLTGRLIDFFRGKDSFEEDTGVKCHYTDLGLRQGTCPDRKYPLADIYHSRVKFVGTPSQMYTYNGYRNYQKDNIKTVAQSILIFGANDGLLHAINPDDSSGQELWSFVPPTLLARLKDIVGNDQFNKTVSQFYLDSSARVMDVCDGNNCASSKANWKRVLVMGFGEAQEAIMALDITNLTKPQFMWAILNETPRIYKSPLFNDLQNCSNFKRVLRWDKDGNIFAYSNLDEEMNPADELVHDRSDHIKKTDSKLSEHPEYDYSLLSKTWSEPVIAQLGGDDSNTGKFVAVIGGGGNYPYKTVNPNEVSTNDNATCYNSDSDFGRVVYMIDIMNDGKILTRYEIPANTNDIPARVPARVSILPKPQQAGLSGIQNRIMAQIYTADMSGRVWRMTVDDTDVNGSGKVIRCKDDNSNNLKCLKLYDNKSTKAHKDYFFQSVAITYDGKTSNVGNTLLNDDTSVWVYAGSGDTSLEGIKDNSGNNVLVAIKDHYWELSDTAGQSINGEGVDINDLRVLPVNIESDPNKCTKEDYKDEKGWVYKLPANYKLVGKPVIIGGYVYFTVYEHGVDNTASSECSGHLGTSWLYSFKLFSGCHNSAFDKMGDGTDNSSNNKFRAKLGKGLATAPVLRGNTMYFGISGQADPNAADPILGQGKRDENIIRWDRPNDNDATLGKSSNVPFAYFNEVY